MDTVQEGSSPLAILARSAFGIDLAARSDELVVLLEQACSAGLMFLDVFASQRVLLQRAEGSERQTATEAPPPGSERLTWDRAATDPSPNRNARGCVTSSTRRAPARRPDRVSFANFQPHIHAIVTAGLIERGGIFHPLSGLDTEAIEQGFRRLVLDRLVRAERLSEAFRENLLSWEHSGFSVHAGEAIESTGQESLERMARYMTRTPVAMGKVFEQKDGRVKLLTPRDPKTGLDHLLFDPLDWIHAITTQIPDARQHLVRYQGAYANTVRSIYRPEVGEPSAEIKTVEDSASEDMSTRVTTGARGNSLDSSREDEASSFDMHRRRSWARLLRRIYEVDPLVCPCGGELKIVSVITDPVVVDRILSHRKEKRLKSPFAARAPPAA
jgi:hypothetical protein